MAWTYSGDPAASDLDLVRFLIGDTDTNEQLLQDGEINYLVANTSSTNMAASKAARAIAAKFARQVDESVGDMQLTLSQRITHYLQLALNLESKVGCAPRYMEPHDTLWSIKDEIEALDSESETVE